MCNLFESDGRTVVLCHEGFKIFCISESRTLTVPVLNVSIGLFHTLSAERTGITLDSIGNIKMLSITCYHYISAPVSTLFWILYFQALSLLLPS
jgi:hypothetical protein